jgi:hypothetical protein
MRRVHGIVLALVLVACGDTSIGSEPDGIPLPSRETAQRDSGSSTQGADDVVVPTSFALNVALTGTGKGEITSTPSGLTCTATSCTGTFPAGSDVALSAKPEAGAILGAWSGACSGTTDCKVTMSADASVGAELTTLVGTWSGSYTNTRQVQGCTFNNAGTLSAKVSLDAAAAMGTTASVDGLEIRQIPGCGLAGKSTGAAPSSAVTSTGNKLTGTWTMNVAGVGGTLAFPFTGTVSGKTFTGSWTCPTCTGTFTLTLQ